MKVLRAILAIIGVTFDHVPDLHLQWKGAQDSKTFKTCTIFNPINSRPPGISQAEGLVFFLPPFFIWTVCWEKGYSSSLSSYRKKVFNCWGCLV